MKTCSVCGGSVRDEAVFCTSCGAPMKSGAKRSSDPQDSSAPITTVPLITLAPMPRSFSKQRVVRYGKTMIGIVLVIILAVSAAAVAAWLSTEPFKESGFEEVQNDKYRQCLTLVSEVRNDNFDDIVEDLVNMSGEAEGYNFLTEYEKTFKRLVPDESSTEQEIKFRNCCFMVSYTEFQAKRYENLSEKALIGTFYLAKADQFRGYADELWGMLNDAKTNNELQAIMDYCDKYDIIRLKDSGAEVPADTAEEG